MTGAAVGAAVATVPTGSAGSAGLAGPAASQPAARPPALLSLRGVRRDFASGDDRITVLQDIDIDIAAGEMVAIVGQSGSGKSTLMNILGCLDQPSAGSYHVAGHATGALGADALAALRRGHFGFIFQRYHLLSDLTALGNVEMPAVYANAPAAARHARSRALLARLGLSERLHHRPGQLSGGQQQRVSIARALMNGGAVILADEPTGALDSTSGEEVMRILQELHAEGHTIIIVTHDMQVAAHAERIIELHDGRVTGDRPTTRARTTQAPLLPPRVAGRAGIGIWLTRLTEALRMALLAMNAHRLRTFLTMLGIVIGIASVVAVVALGEGARRSVLASINNLGTNTVDVFPGKSFGDTRAAAIHTLVPADADALAQQPSVDSVTPNVSSTLTLRYGNVEATLTVHGVGAQYFRVYDVKLAQGVAFREGSVQSREQVAVIDDNTRAKLFPNGRNAIGAVILLGSVPVRIIGVAEKKVSILPGGDTLNVYVPYTTALGRIVNQGWLRNISVRVADSVPTDAAQQQIERFMAQRHGRTDFFLFNTDTIRTTVDTITQLLTLLIGAIAVISLVVGGIGVMNIMLVSVTERTREIGVRMAVGARHSDIQQQFLIEAVLVCLFGGVIGVVLALGLGLAFALAGTEFRPIYSVATMVAAFGSSTLVGVVFGYVPARNAARLDPVVALARE